MRPFVTLDRDSAHIALVAVLKNAHAGELGAARAYRGHWRSLRDALEVVEIQQIESEELEHRRHWAPCCVSSTSLRTPASSEPLMPQLHIWESFEYFLLLSASLLRGGRRLDSGTRVHHLLDSVDQF